MNDTILDVRDLRVEFPLARGLVAAVDGASFDLRRGEALGFVGNPAPARRWRCGALSASSHAKRASRKAILFEGADLARVSAEDLRKVRGHDIAMIFQEPLTALNPVMRAGDQIAEGPRLRLAQPAEGARARNLMQQVGIPDPPGATRPILTSCRVACSSG